MSLTEWHRYVDRHSRRVVRDDDEVDEVAAWRPWHEPEGDTEEAILEKLQAPDLATLLGDIALPRSTAPARPVFTDLTIDDRLPALPEYRALELQVPTFELNVPRLAELASQTSTRTPAAEPAPTPEDAVFKRLKAAQNWDLLARLKGAEPGEVQEPAPDGARSRLGESRQELIERLVDPTLTLEQTAMILQVCPTTVRRYTNKGLLRHFRTKGNQRRFRFSDVLEFMEARAAEIEQDVQADRAAGRTGEGAPAEERP